MSTREERDTATGPLRPRSPLRPTDVAALLHAGDPEPARIKKSITLHSLVAEGVEHHVDQGKAPSFSAAMNDAAARWVASQNLRAMLDDRYEDDPDARPTDDELARARAALGLS